MSSTDSPIVEPLPATPLKMLHEIAFFQYRVGARLDARYEQGWNDAVDCLTAKARQWFSAQAITADSLPEECDV